MSGNRFGDRFSVTTFGESHGKAIGCIIDGCPALMPLAEEDIQHDLDRRKPGTSRYTTARRETDEVEILSGVFEGQTTGTPIALLIRNTDQRSQDYSKIKNIYRPSHADFSYDQKYGIRDYRGGGRSSARETAMRVAAGAIAKKYLWQQHKTLIRGYVNQIGDIHIGTSFDWQCVEKNPFFCPDIHCVAAFENYLNDLKKQGDSVGAVLTVQVDYPPMGIGEPVFDRLDADIAKALMSINAVKGVEIGAGFASASAQGSEFRDEMDASGFLSNTAGGILGGISTGQRISAKLALKPTSSIAKVGKSVNSEGKVVEVSVKGRHDPCVGIRAVPIAEAMVALTLMDHLLKHRGQNYDWLQNN